MPASQHPLRQMYHGEYSVPNALILFGVPGAGKSTLAKHLQVEVPNTIVIDSDDVSSAAVKLGIPSTDGFMICFNFLRPFLQRNSSSSTNIVFCAALPDFKRFEIAAEAFSESFGARCHLVNIQCDVDIAFERVRLRESLQVASNSKEHITLVRDFHLKLVSELGDVLILRNEGADDKAKATRVLSDLLHS